MTSVAPHSVIVRPFPPVHRPRGSRFLGYLSTTDPKVLGVMYIVMWFVFFMAGGLLALLMRAEMVKSRRDGETTTADDPWGYGNSVEWATSCPPPRHNFTSLPRVRSERPAFELHHPQMVDRLRAEAHPHRGWHPLQATESSTHLAIGAASKDPGETHT